MSALLNAASVRLKESIKWAEVRVRWANIPVYISINLQPIDAWLRGSWISLIWVSLCLCLQLTSITSLTSDCSFWTAPNGGPAAVRNPTHTRARTQRRVNPKTGVYCTIRSLKFNDLLHPLSYQINDNISPRVADIVWPFMLAVQAMSALRGCDKTCTQCRFIKRNSSRVTANKSNSTRLQQLFTGGEAEWQWLKYMFASK